MPKSMKIEVHGGLGGSGRRLGSVLEPRWRPRSLREAPRDAKKPNMALRWANLVQRWGPTYAQTSVKALEKNKCSRDSSAPAAAAQSQRERKIIAWRAEDINR